MTILTKYYLVTFSGVQTCVTMSGYKQKILYNIKLKKIIFRALIFWKTLVSFFKYQQFKNLKPILLIYDKQP